MSGRVLVSGASAYGLDNLSDDCMLLALCEGLRDRHPGVDIALLCRHPSEAVASSLGVRVLKNLDHETREASRGRWFDGLNPGDDRSALRAIWAEMEAADVLVISGAPFIDLAIGFMHGLIPYVTILVALARFTGTPVVFSGLHMGRPLTTEAGRELARFCASNADRITIRDRGCRSFLEDLGVADELIVDSADAAYALHPVVDGREGRLLLDGLGVDPAARLVLVTFRMMYWTWDDATVEQYADRMAAVCDHIVDRHDVDLLLVPHNTYDIDRTYMDDRPGHDLIASRCRRPQRVHPVRERWSVRETLSVFPHVEAFLSNRRHTAIFAALHGKTGVSTGEPDHVRPILEQLGASHRFVALEGLHRGEFEAAFDGMWGSRDEDARRAAERLPHLRALAEKNAEIVGEYVSD